MKKIIILIALIMMTGCGAPTAEIPENPPAVEAPGEEYPEEDKEDTDNLNEDKELSDEEILASIDLSLNPNELGEIMILMYHGIGPEESVWQRTPDNFRKDLEYMYQNGYRMISLNDYAKGEIKTEAGYTPIILTFDDGRQNNFSYIEENGKIVIDPDCAIGILEEFKNKYPDFNVTASFFWELICSDKRNMQKKNLIGLLKTDMIWETTPTAIMRWQN